MTVTDADAVRREDRRRGGGARIGLAGRGGGGRAGASGRAGGNARARMLRHRRSAAPTLAGHGSSTTRRRTQPLNSAAPSSIAPRNAWNQSASTPVMTSPCCTIPKMSAPNTAPTAEP